MFADLQLFSVGLAAVIDTVLLLAMAERRNRRSILLPVILLIAGAWLWHAGAFAQLLTVDLDSRWALRVHWLAMMVMAGGALLMPSALLHGLWRLQATGLALPDRPRPRHALCYLPLLALLPVGCLLAAAASGSFLELISPLVGPYVLWIGLVNLAAAGGLLLLRSRIEMPRARSFFSGLAAVLFLITLLLAFNFAYALKAWPRWEEPLFLSMILAPVLPALYFAYFVIRFNFMQLMLERTLVYGGILAGMWLFHRTAIEELNVRFADRYRVDFGLLEGIALLALMVLYPPLRQRLAEALRYLMGSRVAGWRERARQLAVQLSRVAGQPLEEILAWFAGAVKSAAQAQYAAGWLIEPSGRIGGRAGDTPPLAEEDVLRLHGELRSAGLPLCARLDAPSGAVHRLLEKAKASLAMSFQHDRVSGLLLLGRRARNREFGEEEMSELLLLMEQLGTALNSSLLQAERLAAERRALESEKLSALGLLSSSIAHEIKNPLSSIKTIASVMAEELGPRSEHAEDLRLILGELDRLSITTSQLLEFARPAAPGLKGCSVGDLLQKTLRILEHLARQKKIHVDSQIEGNLPPVPADENALREIFFNLIANSLEAAGPGGRIAVSCRSQNGQIIAEFRDSGPGLAPEIQAHLFEPFFTTKPNGTGLGLHIVSRRVRELGGEIRCESVPGGSGTSFTIKIPVERPP
ncbi:MAG: hypothetical protein HY717_01460 [Planctomycetes bacterium]|nr:hypothetical protein [Planctomycetota bacterium]